LVLVTVGVGEVVPVGSPVLPASVPPLFPQFQLNLPQVSVGEGVGELLMEGLGELLGVGLADSDGEADGVGLGLGLGLRISPTFPAFGKGSCLEFFRATAM
jgi:hypothetical protein